MIPEVANIDPGVNAFHLFFIDGPTWNKIEIPVNKESNIVSHLPYRIRPPAYSVILAIPLSSDLTFSFSSINFR